MKKCILQSAIGALILCIICSIIDIIGIMGFNKMPIALTGEGGEVIIHYGFGISFEEFFPLVESGADSYSNSMSFSIASLIVSFLACFVVVFIIRLLVEKIKNSKK